MTNIRNKIIKELKRGVANSTFRNSSLGVVEFNRDDDIIIISIDGMFKVAATKWNGSWIFWAWSGADTLRKLGFSLANDWSFLDQSVARFVESPLQFGHYEWGKNHFIIIFRRFDEDYDGNLFESDRISLSLEILPILKLWGENVIS